MADEVKQTEVSQTEGQENQLTEEEAHIAERADDMLKTQGLEGKTRERLDIVFDEKPTPEPDKSTSEKTDEEKTDESEEKDESTSETTDESKTEDKSTSDESDKQTDEAGDKTAGDDTKLTQAEIRAAIHQGWEQKDLDELVKTNPGLAKRTCAKLLESTNNISKKFAELGKSVKQSSAVKKDEHVKKDEPVKHEKKRKPIDLTAVEEEYADDPLLPVLKQVVEENNNFAAELDNLKTSVPAGSSEADTKKKEAEVAEDSFITQQIETFFVRPDVASYKDFYGNVPKGSKDWKDLTQRQLENRWKVVEQANEILLGAQQQGTEMTLDEAFERAHLLATVEVREQKTREKIKSEAKARGKGLSFEPSSSASLAKSGELTKTEREKRAGKNLKKVFG